MQFRGGYRYPGTALCSLFTVVAVLSALGIAYWKGLAPLRALTLFLNLEGTVLLASAFTPTGLAPPQGSLGGRLRWFFGQPGGVPVKFSQPLFYGGVLALFLGALLGVLH